jgi:Ca-activated chloride channel family protein
MAEDWAGAQAGRMRADLREQITQLGLSHRLMTPFTSFVAVEEQTIVEGGRRRTIQVPVEMPDHVSPEGVFGDQAQVKVAGGIATFAPVVGGQVPDANRRSRSSMPSAPSSAPQPGEAAAGRTETPKDNDIRTQSTDTIRDRLASRLHPSLLRIVDCAERARAAGQPLTPCGVDANGRVAIRIWLTQATDATILRHLAASGFMPNATIRAIPAGTPFEGRIDLARLPGLAGLAEVTLISAAR